MSNEKKNSYKYNIVNKVSVLLRYYGYALQFLMVTTNEVLRRYSTTKGFLSIIQWVFVWSRVEAVMTHGNLIPFVFPSMIANMPLLKDTIYVCVTVKMPTELNNHQLYLYCRALKNSHKGSYYLVIQLQLTLCSLYSMVYDCSILCTMLLFLCYEYLHFCWWDAVSGGFS